MSQVCGFVNVLQKVRSEGSCDGGGDGEGEGEGERVSQGTRDIVICQSTRLLGGRDGDM